MAEAEAEWAPKQDMSLLCRVCANQHDYLIPIFQGEGLDHEMPTKMGKHLPIKVRATDKLPTQMCYQCASTIIAWSELHTNCLAADKKLKGMLKKDGVVEDDNAASDHYEDAFDDGGGAQDDDDEEDFEKEIKQLISDAGVELGSNKEVKRAPRVPVTRKRKAEVTITPVVKKEPKKLKTEPLPAKSSASKSTSAKSNASASKTSTALVKPKEEVVPNEERCMIWACCKCIAKYTSWPHLREHILLSHSSNLVAGALCCEVDSHYKPILGSDCYYCAHCDQVFDKKIILEFHLKMEHGKMLFPNFQWYLCKICANRFFNRTSDIRKHMQDVHCNFNVDTDALQVTSMLDIIFSCQVCNEFCVLSRYCVKHKMFNVEPKLSPSNYISPCKDHNALYPNCHSCQKCNRMFSDCKNLWSHMFIAHDADKDLHCNLCFPHSKIIMKYPHILVRHLKQQHKMQVNIYIAYKKLRKETSLTINDVTQFKCPECPAVLQNFKNLKCHLETHCGEKGFRCEHCNGLFIRHSTLMNHIRGVHEKIRKHQCTMCGKAFTFSSNLTQHIRLYHKNEKKFICEVCGASFGTRGTLNNHRYVHEDKRFVCTYCGHAYRNPLMLKRHLVETHFKHSLSVCDICGKELKSSRTLHQHKMSVHSTERPFICHICNASYKLKKHLNHHLKKHLKALENVC